MQNPGDTVRKASRWSSRQNGAAIVVTYHALAHPGHEDLSVVRIRVLEGTPVLNPIAGIFIGVGERGGQICGVTVSTLLKQKTSE